MTQVALSLDGFCCGPLFAPIRKVRENQRLRMSGGAEVWIKYRRARPPYANRKAIRAFWAESMRLTAETGVQHSVDHIVPLISPFVCGLHWEHNLQVRPLAENIRKSNSEWPGMWAEQPDLFS